MLFSSKEFAKLRGSYARDGVLRVDHDRRSAGLGNGERKASQTGKRDRNPGDDQFRLPKIPVQNLNTNCKCRPLRSGSPFLTV
jgi:hypothetical protein